MNWLRRLANKDRLEREMSQELRFHFEQQVQQYLKAGLSADEAHRKTCIDFRGMDQIREECREVRQPILLQTILQDFAFAWRTCRKDWVFSLVAIALLALGVGANTAVFS